MRLAAPDIRRLAAAQAVLLSPLDYETREAWWLASMRAVKDAVRCDIASIAVNSPTGIAGATEDFDTGLFDAFRRFDEDDLHHVRAVSRSLEQRTPVFMAGEAMKRHCQRRLEDTRIYQEFMFPAGVRDGPIMAVTHAGHTLTMGLARGHPHQTDRTYDHARALLGLLVPCLANGLRLIASVDHQREDMVAMMDRSGAAFSIIGEDGRELHRNARFAELLEAEPERARLIEAVARVSASSDAAAEDLSRERTLRVPASSALYEIGAVTCRPAAFAYRPVVVVFIHRHGPALPTVEHLHRRWGLSEREAQVALLLARGASNKAIGRALGIRPATVRTHGERVFVKLGVHTRKALGLVLIGT